MLKSIKQSLDSRERAGFKLHIIYMALEGVILGILALNEFFFIKSLYGSKFMMSIILMFSMAVYTFLLFINEFLKRIKNKKKMLRIVAVLTRAPLALVFFFPTEKEVLLGNPIYHYLYISIFLIYFFGNTVINPTINLLLKKNYRHENFGKLYSYSSSLNKIIMFICTFVYGFMLDADPTIFIYAFPLMAILGVSSLFFLSRIPVTLEVTEKKEKIMVSVKKSMIEMFSILRFNKPFQHFQIGFMLYGFSFMVSVAGIAIYFAEDLGLNYTSISFYRNSYNILAIIILPFFGKLLGNIDPRKFALYTFGSLAGYIFFLIMTDYFPYKFDIPSFNIGSFKMESITIYYTLILYILSHGVFAATMVLLWNIGSAYFCKAEEAGTYQSIHLFLTGVRSLFAYIVGVTVYEMYGAKVTFTIALISILSGILVMYLSYRSIKVEKEEVRKAA